MQILFAGLGSLELLPKALIGLNVCGDFHFHVIAFFGLDLQ